MIEDELRETPLFANVSPAGLAVAAGDAFEAAAGEVLTRAGDRGSGMYLVLDGQVIVELRDRQIEIGPGGFFGELALLVPDAERVARVRAATSVRAVSIPRPTFEHLLETEPGFVRALLTELAKRLLAVRTVA
jgi:CRP-like cAMP-binding protein